MGISLRCAFFLCGKSGEKFMKTWRETKKKFFPVDVLTITCAADFYLFSAVRYNKICCSDVIYDITAFFFCTLMDKSISETEKYRFYGVARLKSISDFKYIR